VFFSKWDVKDHIYTILVSHNATRKPFIFLSYPVGESYKGCIKAAKNLTEFNGTESIL